ncbi:MarR family winged helix-turn-helix transcriptional regulator [Roseomonas sp. F4]
MPIPRRQPRDRAGLPDAAAPPDMSPLDHKLGFRLRLAQQTAFEAFHRLMSPLGLTPGRMGVLLLLEVNPDIRQTVLAEALRIKPSNLTVLLAALEAEGLVRRAEEAGNRRANLLRLTPAGRALLMRAKAAEAEVERQLTDSLTPPERAALISALARVAAG